MNQFLESIVKIYPEFKNSSVEMVDHGQNNQILILEKKVIFRFPKSERNKRALTIEYDTLLILKEKINFKIPDFKYHHFATSLIENFVGYEMIHGEPLFKAVFLEKDHRLLGLQLSNILRELHQPNLRRQLESRVKVIDPYIIWEDMYLRIKEKLFVFMNEEAKEETRKNFEDILHALGDVNFESTLIHGDFGPSNIIVSQNDSTINGIIDFGEVHIGDPAVDIASLIGPLGYGEAFILNHFDSYPDAKNLLKRAKLYTKTFALQEALYGIENDDQRAFDTGIKIYI